MLGEQVLGVSIAADRLQSRVEGTLLGVCMQRHVEGDLISQHSPVTATSLDVLELALDQRMIIDYQVVDVSGRVG